MFKLLIATLLILVANISFAHKNLPEKSASCILDTVPVKLDARANKVTDSSILVVCDGKVLGTIKELKTLSSIISPDSIRSINILKDIAAFARYGDKGKNGVIEIYTKKAVISQGKECHYPTS